MFQFKLVLLGAWRCYGSRWTRRSSTRALTKAAVLRGDGGHAPPPPGDSAVGKSSLVLRFVKGQFHEYQESTIGGTLEGGRRRRSSTCAC